MTRPVTFGGRTFIVPDDATDDEVAEIIESGERDKRMAALPQSMANIEADQAGYNPTEGMSSMDRFWAGAGKAAVDLDRGAQQLRDEAVARTADFFAPRDRNLSGLITGEQPKTRTQELYDQQKEVQRLDAPLMATTAGKVGNLAGNVAIAAPAAFIPGANTYAGSAALGAGLGLLQPVTSGNQRFLNTAVGGAAGGAGQIIGEQAVAPALARGAAARAQRQAEESVRDATIREAQQVGYRVPLATINPESTTAQAVESIGGRAGTDQSFAWHNQRVTDRLVKEDLGLSRRAQLTPQSLDAVRARHGRIYEAIGNTGRITPDNQYLNEIAQLGNVLDDIATEFPGAAAPSGERIRELADSLFQPGFDARRAVNYVKELRQQAKGNFQTAHTAGGGNESLALARAQRQAAGALEEMIMRSLRAKGVPHLADQFNRARTVIAKAHDAETALVEGTGHIDALKLRTLLNRGKPLGGNMETIARSAQTLDRSMQHLAKGPGVSALTASIAGPTALGAIGSLLTGNPAAATALALPTAWAAGRSLSRGLARSTPAQILARPTYTSPLLDVAQRSAPYGGVLGAGLVPPLAPWGPDQ